MEYNWIDASTEDGCKRLEELLDRRKRVIGRVHEILTEFFVCVHKSLVTTEYYDIGGTYHHCKLDASMLHGVEFLDPELQWHQMTPDTKFEDGEWVCFKFESGNIGAYQRDEARKTFKQESQDRIVVLHSWIGLKFFRIPK